MMQDIVHALLPWVDEYLLASSCVYASELTHMKNSDVNVPGALGLPALNNC